MEYILIHGVLIRSFNFVKMVAFFALMVVESLLFCLHEGAPREVMLLS